jgi:outer membrane immunogenic protein
VKKLLVAGIAAFAFCSLPAFATDLPIKAPIYKAPPMFSWTGFYVGGTVGGGWGDTFQFDPAGRSQNQNWNGLVGGATAGFNWQFGSWVLGVETDISGSDVKKSWSTVPGWGCVTADGCINKVDWFGTTRGRVGYAFDRILPYATVGIAYGRVRGQFGVGCPSACNTSTESGLTFGGGVEWAFAPNWSAKIEYLRADLGSTGFQNPGGGDPLGLGKNELNIVRAGLNYRFGDWDRSSLSAKY